MSRGVGLFLALLLSAACTAEEPVRRPDAKGRSGPDAAPGDAALGVRADAAPDPVGEPADVSVPADAATPPVPVRIQLFTRTQGFRHDSIEVALRALVAAAAERGAVARQTEDAAEVVAGLAETDVLVFLMTSGDCSYAM